MHRLLSRQVLKTLGRLDGHPPEVMRLISAVDAAYHQSDEDRAMLERSMALSSGELVERNAELTSAEEKYRSIFENATEGIFQLSTEGDITVANPAMSAILGAEEAGALVTGPGKRRLRDAIPDGAWTELYSTGNALVHDLHLSRLDGAPIVVAVSMRGHRDRRGRVIHIDGTLRDVTARVLAEVERKELHGKLVDASRRAGMAEVATGVLHNVGNVLNSMNVSLSLVSRRIASMKVGSLDRAAKMLGERPLGTRGIFVEEDEKGRRLPEFFLQLSANLALDQSMLVGEVAALEKYLDHVKGVIAMQQNYARTTGVVERVSLSDVIDEALRLEGASLAKHGLDVELDLAETPMLMVDKHQVIQILVNLITNAKQAMGQVHGRPRRLVLRTGVTEKGGGRVYVEVKDTGVGIPPQYLTEIFNHGFTTKSNGHGFGLHASANSAKAMRGSLEASSEGLDCGACFRLELPVAGPSEAQLLEAMVASPSANTTPVEVPVVPEGTWRAA
ncbi:MAG: PAS domain S-box protein [Myxococcales bacterium]|nr:PAS domain S-box protein [Myxococcales bacterium]